MKICILYNFAQKYREGIFKLIEDTYDCSWVFGDNDTDIKGFNLSIFKDARTAKTKRLGPFYWLSGTIDIFKKNDNFLMLGELFSISVWTMLILRHTFFRSKRIFLWSHGWYGREGFLKKCLKRIYFGLSDQTLLYGNYAVTIARKQGYRKNNLAVIHNSLDYNRQLELRQQLGPSTIYRQHFGNNYPVLIFIGRLTSVKKLDLLVEALTILKAKDKKYNLVFVGDGIERHPLEILVKEKGLSSCVWFYGACYDEAINAELVFNADLCVAPGNVGLTAMHSMVYGTPVITHNDFAWQMPEFESIIPGITGDFFKRGDVDSLQHKIEEWFSKHKDKREFVRQACYKEIANNWTPDFQIDVIKKHIKI